MGPVQAKEGYAAEIEGYFNIFKQGIKGFEMRYFWVLSVGIVVAAALIAGPSVTTDAGQGNDKGVGKSERGGGVRLDKKDRRANDVNLRVDVEKKNNRGKDLRGNGRERDVRIFDSDFNLFGSGLGLPPGLAKRDILPPGLEKRDALPPGLAKGHDTPPGLAKRDSLPPGLSN